MSKCETRKIIAISLLLMGGTSEIVHAATSEWRNVPYHYSVVNESVVDVLKNFGFNAGLRMSIAADISGTVRGRIDAKTAGSFLEALARSNGLDWYYDGSVLYVSLVSSEQTVAVALHGVAFEKIRASLTRSKLTDERYGLSGGGSTSYAIVSGPPSYVAVVRQAIEMEASRDNAVIIYRGSQASNVKFP
jgi:type II secretory pathway component GspD/PulD (secretin)